MRQAGAVSPNGGDYTAGVANIKDGLKNNHNLSPSVTAMWNLRDTFVPDHKQLEMLEEDATLLLGDGQMVMANDSAWGTQ